MMESTNFTFKQAMLEPGECFGTPEDLCRSDIFTLDQKITILRMWAYDAQLEQQAEAENMHSDKEVMLGRILKCLFQLAEEQKVAQKH